MHAEEEDVTTATATRTPATTTRTATATTATTTTRGMIDIVATGGAGALYAAQSLLQMTRHGDGLIPRVRIADWPRFEVPNPNP